MRPSVSFRAADVEAVAGVLGGFASSARWAMRTALVAHLRPRCVERDTVRWPDERREPVLYANTSVIGGLLDSLVVKVEELRRMAGTLADVLPIEILPEIDRQELAGHMTLRKFRQDEVVYHQGDPAAHWFVVFEGLVKVLLLDENGRELLISLHSRGEFFGELVIFEDKVPRDGTAVCVVPTSVFQIDRDGSLAVLRRNEDARKHMFERLSRNIRKLEGQVEDFAFLDVTSRLAKYLVEVARLGRPLPLTQDDLASAIGSTRMTVNKLLADFERRGFINVERRNVRVLDEKSLIREIRV